jgi:hypothetical protein
MLTTGKLVHKGKEVAPQGSAVNLKHEPDGPFTWGTIDAPQKITVGAGSICQLVLDDPGRSFEVVVRELGKKKGRGLLIVFDVNGLEL